MSLSLRALSGAIWNAIENAGSQLTSFVLFLVFARLISPDEIGVVQMAITLLGFLTIFVEHGFTARIIRSQTVARPMLDTAFWLGLSGGTALAVVLTLSADAIAAAYRSPALAPVLRVLSWTIPLITLSSVQTALLIRDLAFRTQALRRLIAVLAGGVVGVGLAVAGFGVWSLVARLAVESTLDCLIAWRLSPFRPGRDVSRQEGRAYLTFGSQIVGSYAVGFFNRRTDDLLIGFVLGPVALGYYAVAARAVSLVTEVALRAAQRTAIPVFSRLQDDPARLRDAYYTAVELAAMVACPIYFGLSAVSPELCVTLFGEKWAPVVPAMQVLGLTGVAMSVSIYLVPVLVSLGRADWLLYFSLIETALNVAGAALAVRYGIVAVAISYVVRSYLILPLILFVTRQAIGTDTRKIVRSLFAPAMASAVMLAAVWAIRRAALPLPAFVTLALMVAAGALSYGTTLWLLGRASITRFIAAFRQHRARPLIANDGAQA